MSKQNCSCGQKAKSGLICGICESPVCKSCTTFLEEGQFSFLETIPADLAHSAYCGSCFSEKVAPELNTYLELIDRAKNILVYEKNQSKETRLLNRHEKPIKVEDCPDKAETMLRLAFFAAKANFNAVIDVDIIGKKVSEGGSYKRTVYSGTGIPTNVQANKIVRDKSLWHNPN